MANILSNERPERFRRRKSQKTQKVNHDQETPLAESELSLRLINALERHGIMTVEQLGNLSNAQIEQVVKSGRHNNEEVMQVLRKHGFRE